MNLRPGDVVKIGAGFIDWEVVGVSADRRVVLRSGMTGRRCVERIENLRLWKPHA